MPSSWILRRVALVRTDVSADRLVVTLSLVPSSLLLVTLLMKAIRSTETSVFTRATLRNTQEHGILHSHFGEIKYKEKFKF
jgi:hypothetical protein